MQYQGASLPSDDRVGHLLLQMQLETRALRVLVSAYCCSTYRVANPFSSLGTFSSSSIGGPVFHPIMTVSTTSVFAKHWHSLTRDSYIRVLSAKSCWQCTSICVRWLIMGWTPRWGSFWMVYPFVLVPNFVSVTPSMGILFPILRRNEVSSISLPFS